MIQLIPSAGALAAPLALLVAAGGPAPAPGYDVTPARAADGAAWQAEHRRFDMQSRFASTRVVARSASAGWELELDVRAWGRAGALRAVPPVEAAARGPRVEWTAGDLTAWYVHDERGLQQGFTVDARPDGDADAPLTVRVGLGGSLRAEGSGSSLALVGDDGRALLRYGGLAAWDAAGESLPARLEARPDGFDVVVDDAGAAYPVVIDPLLVVLQQQVFASDRQNGDSFGVAVAVSGDVLVVGADQEDAGGLDAGAAYVYSRVGTAWSEEAKLTAFDASGNDRYGAAVAVDGDTIAIGSELDDDLGSASGSVYVYRRSGTTWPLEQKLNASDGVLGDIFGASLALEGDRLVVGAPQDDDFGSASGAVYVFDRTGTVWTETAKLTASDASSFDFFGGTLDISGTSVITGASGVNRGLGADQGAVYILVDSGSGWIEQQKITAVDGAMGYFFGSSVAIHQDRIAVGSDGHSLAGLQAGAIYVYERDGLGFWSQTAFIIPPTAGFGDFLGEAVALQREFLLFSARGDDEIDLDAGAAYVYQREGTAWLEAQKVVDPGGATGDDFGVSVALDELTFVIGANFDDEPSGDTGSAFVYTLEPMQDIYCTGKTNSVGCAPFITVRGYPSVTSTINYRIIANDVVPGEAGFPVYGFTRGNLNFHGGKLCVKPPFKRLLPAKTANSNGIGACKGEMRRNFNNHIQFGGDPLLTAGQTVMLQWRQRDGNDPLGFGDTLTDAIEFTICP